MAAGGGDINWAASLHLHLGCGGKHLPAPWVNADVVEAPLIAGRVGLGPDVVLDITRDLAALPPATLHWIYWCHGPEHVRPDQLPAVLAQLRTALVPRGRLTLATIDLQRLARHAVEATVPAWEWNHHLYGEARSDSPAGMHHHQCFNYAYLTELLTAAGFSEVRPWAPAQYPLIAQLFDCAVTAEPISCYAEGVA
jgi:hypothetical protein